MNITNTGSTLRTSLDENVMAQINKNSTADTQSQPTQQGQPKKKSDYKLELFEEGTVPKDQIKVTQMSAKELCSLISSKFLQIFNDYKGCSFRPAQNGLLEFVMIFEDHNTRNGMIKNIERIGMGSNNSATINYVETINQNRNGRRTMTLTAETREIMEQFMIRPIENKNGRHQPGNIKWDQCIEEKEVGGQMIQYSTYGRPQTLLLVRNINVEAIIDNIWTPTEQKQKDAEKAKADAERYGRKDVVVIPKFQHKINFRGFKTQNQYGQVSFTNMPMQVGPDGNIYPVNVQTLPLENYWLNIETVDTEESAKVVPVVRAAAVPGFISSIY